MSLAFGKNSVNQKQPLHLDGSNHLLVNDSVNKAVLDTIATNTANINVNVGDVEINVADLEALQATTNTTLAAILVDTDAADSSLNTIEAQSVFTASRLNNIQNKISANTDGSGDTLGQINSNILTKNGEIETSMNSLIGANHADLVALEASLTSMEAKQDTMIGHNDGVETILTAIDGRVDGLETLQGTANTHLSEIEGAVETLEGCVSGTELQVDIVGGNITGFATETTLGNAEAHLGNIETAVQLLDNAISGNEMQVDIVGGNITGFATETTLGNAEAHLGNIETAVQLLDNAISGNEMQVDIVTSALPSGASTLAKQDTIIGHVDGIEALLGTIDADTGAIKTAVEILDNAISGNEMQVDVITLPSLATGSNTIGTVNLSATDNAVLDAIDTVLDNIKADAMVETVIFNAQINASATGTSSAFERPRNATNWAILIENTSDSNGNHEINLSRSVNNSFYITPSTDFNSVGDTNNVIEFTGLSTTGTNKYYKIVINNQDSSNHTYKVTVCA